ncbi:GIY-YIG nuclease family protein [Limnofasciculus baicalensis]|uniref:GIY-YIG nuclease family protein n=1 Tax=Limnofasciculus baicalensis BBK-W-15 TaxID=2699891 RepID=A0AAE3GSX1_9CYAN|nr:GIY-YIG nuclease family protein [Limnofasciculus baicalensis]MCP2730160.1 GIY-YIG nuclease family protein [Limnofasciculus baicalensis BBK-W-15]
MNIPVETNQQVPIEDQNIPIEHQGLHNFLYSSDDEHSAANIRIDSNLENNGDSITPLDAWCELSQNAKVAGVYAVLDDKSSTQYIGYSRNVLISLNSHIAQNGKEICAFVRVKTFKYPKRTEMEELRDKWISQLDTIPPGNGESREMWAETVGAAAKAAMSTAEKNAYEEKKIKLRKAMADGTLTKETLTHSTDIQRRQKLEAAVENDDWSNVINES